MSEPFILAGLVSVLSALILYAILMPKGNNGIAFSQQASSSSNGLVKLMSSFGNNLYDALPEGVIKKERRATQHPKIESLIVRSGNPWNLNASEFISIQYLGGFIGLIIGLGVWYFVNSIYELPWYAVVALAGLFGFMIPRMKYNDMAKERDLEFKKELPEALDLLIISLSGGRTFTQSLREIIPNLRKSVLRDEFQNIIKAIDTGKPLNEALNAFAEKSPNDSILTFVRSVQSATEVNAPLIETLEARSAASRQEFFSLLHEKTAQLESKIFISLTPTLMPAAIVVVVAPSLYSMVGTLG